MGVNLKTIPKISRIGWVKWRLWKYSSSEASLWLFWFKRNCWIHWWGQGYNWPWSQQVIKSIRSISKDIGVSDFFIRQIVHEDIHTRWKRANFYHRPWRTRRKINTAKLLNKLNYPLQPNMLLFFSNEKKFYQGWIVSSQNKHWFSLSSQDVSIVMKTKHRVHFTVFRVVTNCGDPFSLPHGLNMKAHTKCQEEVMLLWTERMDAGRPNIRLQDSAPFHVQKSIFSCELISPHIAISLIIICKVQLSE